METHAFARELDYCYVPGSHDELIGQLLNDPPAKGDLGALEYGYWETVRGAPLRKFQPSGLYAGRFRGHECRPGLGGRLQSALLTTLCR